MNIWVNLYSPSAALRFALNILGANRGHCGGEGIKKGELKLRSLNAAELVTLALCRVRGEGAAARLTVTSISGIRGVFNSDLLPRGHGRIHQEVRPPPRGERGAARQGHAFDRPDSLTDRDRRDTSSGRGRGRLWRHLHACDLP